MIVEEEKKFERRNREKMVKKKEMRERKEGEVMRILGGRRGEKKI